MMNRAPLALLLTFVVSGTAAASVETPTGLQGKVTAEASPLAKASVYAYELADLTLQRVFSDDAGRFQFADLPAGVYKVIAYKAGFSPAIVMLSRAANDAHQFVELKLAREETGSARDGEDYWSVRQEIPPDVLRDLRTASLEEVAYDLTAPTPAFRGEVQAMTGFEQTGAAQTSMSGAELGVGARIGSLDVDLAGEFWQLETAEQEANRPFRQGEATSLALDMRGEHSGSGHLDMTTVNQRYGPEAGMAGEADFERFRVSWSQPFGERSRSNFSAQYLSQSNYYRNGQLSPVFLPQASRSLNLEGSYQIDLSDRASIHTGVRYRELEGTASRLDPDDERQALELYGMGGWRAQPSVLLEYGLYTRLQDGSMALAPRGNLVVQLGHQWQTVATASYRVEPGDEIDELYRDPVRFSSASGGCQTLDEHCYRVLLSREGEQQDLLTVAAVHREVAETLQLYFNDDFFNQLESLYLVPGDELPELQVVVQRRIAPQVLARLESSYSQGGGGILYATDHSPYENSVRYLVTSLDTRFQSSATGLFVAFHHLEQGLDPLAVGRGPDTDYDLDRLQLMLSQDLGVLLSAASDLALHLNFEVSRGNLLYTLEDSQADDLRRRVTGGVSLRF